RPRVQCPLTCQLLHSIRERNDANGLRSRLVAESLRQEDEAVERRVEVDHVRQMRRICAGYGNEVPEMHDPARQSSLCGQFRHQGVVVLYASRIQLVVMDGPSAKLPASRNNDRVTPQSIGEAFRELAAVREKQRGAGGGVTGCSN